VILAIRIVESISFRAYFNVPTGDLKSVLEDSSYFKSSCLQEVNIWNPVKGTRDITNPQFARYSE